MFWGGRDDFHPRRLRDPQYKAGSMAYGVPQPAIFVISPQGVIRAKLAEEGAQDAPAARSGARRCRSGEGPLTAPDLT